MNKATTDEQHMQVALQAAKKAFENGEVPIGAVVVNQGKILGIGHNMCEEKKSQTFHAEMVVLAQIRDLDLKNGTIYITHEPCPMCLAALYWARCDAIFYGNSAADASNAGFADATLYEEIGRPLEQRRIPMTRMLAGEAMESFDAWRTLPDRIDY